MYAVPVFDPACILYCGSVGDALVPSGLNDGVAVAEAVGETARPILAIAMEGGMSDGECRSANGSNTKREARANGCKVEVASSAEVGKWQWVDGAVVPPSVGAVLGAGLGGALARRDAQMAALASRVERLERFSP